MIFGRKWHMTVSLPWGPKFCRTISEINTFLVLYRNWRWQLKLAEKRVLVKSGRLNSISREILSKSLHLTLFLR